MYARAGAEAMRDAQVELKKGGDQPDAGADALPETLIRETPAVVIGSTGVDERHHPEFRHVQRRGEGHTKLDRSGHHGVADSRAGAKAAQASSAAQDGLEERRHAAA